MLCAVAPAAGAAHFSSAQVAALTQTINTAITDDGYPSFVIGIWGPHGKSYVRAFGYSNVSTKHPVRTTDRFRVGSITKTFVGTLIMQLAQEGRLGRRGIDEHLSKWDPKIPNAAHITVRSLLNHTSLLPEISDFTTFSLLRDPFQTFKPSQVIQDAVSQPYFVPPPQFNYSDVNYLVLGRIAERVTREPLARLLSQRVLQPLGLDHTYFGPGTSIRGAHAHGYWINNKVQMDVTRWTTSYGWAAGSMVSTLGDLKLWARDLVRGATLDQRAQRERLKFVAVDPAAHYGYGLGIMQLGSFCGHNGLIFGYDSTMLYSSKLGATIVILSGTNPLFAIPPVSNPYPAPPAGVPDTLNIGLLLIPIAFPHYNVNAKPSC